MLFLVDMPVMIFVTGPSSQQSPLQSPQLPPKRSDKGDIFRYLGENQHQNLFLLSIGMAIGGTLLISLPLEVTSCERVTAEVTVPEYGRQTASLFPISIF